MKRLTIILFVLHTSLVSFAQDKGNRLDSLRGLWQDESQADTVRLGALKDYIWDAYLPGKPDSALLLADELLDSSKKLNSPRGEAHAFNIQGQAYYVQDQFKLAVEYFNKSLAIYKKIDRKKAMSWPQTKIANAFREQGNLEKGVNYLDEAAKQYKEDNYAKGEAKSYKAIGDLYWYENKFKEALENYDKALVIAENEKYLKAVSDLLDSKARVSTRLGNFNETISLLEDKIKVDEKRGFVKGVIRSNMNIGAAYIEMGDFEKGLTYFKNNEAKLKSIGDQHGLLNLKYNTGIAYFQIGSYAEALEKMEEVVALSKELGDRKLLSLALNIKAVTFINQGNYPKALNYLLKSQEINQELGDSIAIAELFINFGNIYTYQKDFKKALEYLEKSAAIFEKKGTKRELAQVLGNIGSAYKNLSDTSLALRYLEHAKDINLSLGNKIREAININNIANIYKDMEQFEVAIQGYDKALQIFEAKNYQSGRLSATVGLSATYLKMKDYQKALASSKIALELSINLNSLEREKEVSGFLYEIYKALGQGNKALEYHERMLVLHDSLQSEETQKKLQQMEFQKEMLADSIAKAEEARLIEEAHQEEMRQEENTRNISLGIGAFFILLAGGLYTRVRYIRKSKANLQIEKDRSENLLLNILPEEIAAELKEKGKADARDFDMVSILFTDFKGFTEQSAKLSAADLVNEINHCFKAFDGIMEKYGIEKIKTIGDAYMAAGGLPVPTDDSVKNTVLAALEMQEFIVQRHQTKVQSGEAAFEMRVGIHTGPVVAGIVGVKKFQYDIWGDTVNTASRMESAGEVGKVNVSQATYELLKEDPQFAFEPRGKVAVKGKGEMEMLFVSRKQKNQEA